MKVFLAAFAHETNSFSPLPTTLQSFEADILYRPGDSAAYARALEFPGYGYVLDQARARGDEVVAGMCAWAQPAGPVSRNVYESLRGELLAQLAAADGVGMVVLVLLFKDFLHPATILVALPLSLGGAFVGLLIAQKSFSMPSLIGLMMLMGIATKNSI
eukprot:gene19280-24644_t